jgi:energy-coupling factor transporter ATP-binding protein EcfA2
MELYRIENLNFFYPGKSSAVLKDLSLAINKGEFITLCGQSGCGKTTLLRQLKTVLSPHGEKCGTIFFSGKLLEDWSNCEQSEKIGFVLQSPDNQIVSDKVWHELAFGLESLGYDTQTIRLRVAEMASFFGMEGWFNKSVCSLSGGQKQMLNLASIMVMQPDVLILDEPTSQLDPIAAADFLGAVAKINRELGITIIMSEHRLDEALPYSHRLIVMHEGEIVADGTVLEVGEVLREQNHPMFFAMPTPMRVWAGVEYNLPCPVTVQEGRRWLDTFAEEHGLSFVNKVTQSVFDTHNTMIEFKDIWFKYAKESRDILKGMSMKVPEGSITAILGGNGAGKTTTLSLVSGLYQPYRGEILLDGQPFAFWHAKGFIRYLGVLPQNPKSLFVKKTVELDLLEMMDGLPLSKEEKLCCVKEMALLCRLEGLLASHPFDLSGGEIQRAALAKVLLTYPKILLLDEPTKGMDAFFKESFAQILKRLQENGTTILMVSHDVEFCAHHADLCALFFDGIIVSQGPPKHFFPGNRFYTTVASRMSRHQLPDAVTTEDILEACGKEFIREMDTPTLGNASQDTLNTKILVPKIQYKNPAGELAMEVTKRSHMSIRTKLATTLVLLFIPLTILLGIYYLDDRKYYFISLLVILESMLPFVLAFEGRKPKARELVVLAVMCGIGVAGRAAFFWLPQFKPVVALVMISGIAFGGEAGFFIGTMTGFLSGFFFGQGPWTPWQMFALGFIGFLSGELFKVGLFRFGRLPLILCGGVMTFLLYGGIMDTSTVLLMYDRPTVAMFAATYLLGLPFNLIHGIATMLFLILIGPMMLEKLERIKKKYGLVE